MKQRSTTRQVLIPLLLAATLLGVLVTTSGDAFGQQARTAKSGLEQKLSSNLIDIKQRYEAHVAQPAGIRKTIFEPRNPAVFTDRQYVVIDALPMVSSATLQSQLQSIGAIDVVARETIVSARVPLTAIGKLAQLSELRFARPYMAILWSGLTTSQGDVSQRSDIARSTSSIDGSGVTVGVLSDSYDCTTAGTTATDDVASGDLPAGVNNMLDSCPGSDEGRALMQIVHDVAPGAALMFRSAAVGTATFAFSIDLMVASGANVIVDDIFFFSEPMFQDGVVGQSIDNAVANGVAYFSAAGNAADASYESKFRNSGVSGPNLGMLHDFDPGPGTVTAQPITVPVNTSMTIVLQWNQPFFAVSGAPGASSDVEFYLMASDGTTRLAQSRNINIGADPAEAFFFENTGSFPQGTDTRFFLKIENFAGPDPDLIKYMYIDNFGTVTVDQFATSSGSSYGHSAARGASSVGAASYLDTPAFGVTPPLAESYSGIGEVPIFFDTAGTAISPPELRLKPQIVAPDRVNTTFFGSDIDGDGFPNFGGTSAAAPHAAGAAALLLQFDNTLTPAQIYAALEDSAIDMQTPGYDFGSGHGLLQVDAAVAALANPPPSLSPVAGSFVVVGGTVNIPLTASDTTGGAVSLSAPVLPGFCSLTDNLNGSGNVSCTPTAADVGRHAVVVTVVDVGSPPRSNSQGFYVVVTGTAPANNAPVLAAIGNQPVTAGQVLNIPLSATDTDGDALAFGTTGLPVFCSLSDNFNGSGNINCTPATTDTGPFPITVTVMDNGTPVMNDSEALTITVNAVNQSPVLAAIGNQSVDESATLNVPLSATDADGDALVFGATGLPAFCALTDNLNGTGSINCTPGPTDAGGFPVTVSVTDNGSPVLFDEEAITVTVNDVNRAPVLAAIGNQSVQEAQNLIVPLSASDPDGNALAFGTTGLPAFCSLTDNLNGTGSIDCTPQSGQAGTYPVTVTVTDNGAPPLSDNELFDIVVTAMPGNQAPTLALIGTQNVDTGGLLLIPLSATDPNSGDRLRMSQSGMPAFCSFNDNRDGSGDMDCNPASTDAGTYAVTVTVEDDGTPIMFDSETFDIVVSGVNAAPVLGQLSGQTLKGNKTRAFSLSATDENGDALAFAVPNLPAFCNLTDNGDGSGEISCSPTGLDVGSYALTVTVSDNGVPGLSDSSVFDLLVIQRSTAHDMNGDGLSDILWRNQTTGQNWLYLMNAASITSSIGINTVNTDWNIVGNGDFDDDGNNDILWRNQLTGQNWWYGMSGATIVSSTGVNTVSDTNWKVAGNGDYNGDGDADILWRNSVTGQNWMYLMNGATILSSLGVNTVADTAWEIAGNGDYNGDGLSDILWRNTVTGQNWMYLMNGATIISSLGVNTVPGDWQIAGSGDYNGDARSDILWRNSVTGQIWMYLMNGATISSSLGVNSISTDWQIIGNGDYDGNIKSDILLRNTVTGANWLYLMDGAVIAGSLGVNTVADASWKIINTD